jgi:hypothetical protein
MLRRPRQTRDEEMLVLAEFATWRKSHEFNEELLNQEGEDNMLFRALQSAFPRKIAFLRKMQKAPVLLVEFFQSDACTTLSQLVLAAINDAAQRIDATFPHITVLKHTAKALEERFGAAVLVFDDLTSLFSDTYRNYLPVDCSNISKLANIGSVIQVCLPPASFVTGLATGRAPAMVVPLLNGNGTSALTSVGIFIRPLSPARIEEALRTIPASSAMHASFIAELKVEHEAISMLAQEIFDATGGHARTVGHVVDGLAPMPPKTGEPRHLTFRMAVEAQKSFSTALMPSQSDWSIEDGIDFKQAQYSFLRAVSCAIATDTPLSTAATMPLPTCSGAVRAVPFIDMLGTYSITHLTLDPLSKLQWEGG